MIVLRSIKLIVAIILSLIFTYSLARLVIIVWTNIYTINTEWPDVELWLEQNQLGNYKKLFAKKGKSLMNYGHKKKYITEKLCVIVCRCE